MFCDYQINLGNTTNIANTSVEGVREIFNISGKEGEPYMGGLGI